VIQHGKQRSFPWHEVFPYEVITMVMIVRRHINWNNQRPDLKEDLAHLVDDFKRRICGIASAGSSWFFV
jgi:hypothetical protein